MLHPWKHAKDAQSLQALASPNNSSWCHWLPATRIAEVSGTHAIAKYWELIIITSICVLGIALDGHLKDEDVNLASSTLVGEGKTSADALGIVVSYSIRVKVNCGTLGGELITDVPFKLMHPAPGNVNLPTKQQYLK